RMTVRKALDKLVAEEMVVRKRGQGTFLISKTPKEFIYSLDITTGFFKDIRNYGLRPGSKTLKVDVIQANEKIAALLELNDDTRVIFILRVFYADDEPMMIEKNYMPYAEFKELLQVDLGGLRYPVLKEKYNIVPHHANQTLTAVLCDEEAMEIFGFSKPQAGVELEFMVYDAGDVPIEVGYYLYRGDKFKFNINSIEYLIE
ncbi:MAG: GntR family transcriptional regulator, partial [Deltaproteobacteria bacterium]